LDIKINKLTLTESQISKGYFSPYQRQEATMQNENNEREPVLTRGEKIVVAIAITVNALLSVLWAIVN